MSSHLFAHPALEPLDHHNQRLRDSVHPADYVPPKPASKYNLVVIGGGTAGLVAAAGAAGMGARVALVERHLMGGDCLNMGCVPSKALLSAAHAIGSTRASLKYGVQIPNGFSVDFPGIMERMRRLRADISPHDSVQRFTELGIDVFLGEGRFVDEQTVEVEGHRLRFHRAVIATGARAANPGIPGLDQVPHLTHETLFSLTEIPWRFGVIGAGPVGVEMAQAFALFGSRTTLITSDRGVLPGEDPEAGSVLANQLAQDGVQVLGGARELRVEAVEGGGIRLVHEKAGEAGYNILVDKLLVAAGRTPNTEGLGLEAAGVRCNQQGIEVDDTLRTSNPRIYAAGDVCSRFKFTHAADFMARTVLRNALFMGRAKASALTIPWATYTSPEVARVGWTEAEARSQRVEVDTFTQPFSGVDRALLEESTTGFVRIHVRKGSDQIVGATIVGPHAGDLIGEVTLAMTQKIGLGTLANVIHPYPTRAEAIRKVGDLYNRTRLTPRVKSLFKKWLDFSRGK